jgi:hypothetical protein
LFEGRRVARRAALLVLREPAGLPAAVIRDARLRGGLLDEAELIDRRMDIMRVIRSAAR